MPQEQRLAFQAALRLRLALPVGKLMDGSTVPPASHMRMTCSTHLRQPVTRHPQVP